LDSHSLPRGILGINPFGGEFSCKRTSQLHSEKLTDSASAYRVSAGPHARPPPPPISPIPHLHPYNLASHYLQNVDLEAFWGDFQQGSWNWRAETPRPKARQESSAHCLVQGPDFLSSWSCFCWRPCRRLRLWPSSAVTSRASGMSPKVRLSRRPRRTSSSLTESAVGGVTAETYLFDVT